MARVYKYGCVGLALPHRDRGRQDSVEEGLVDCLHLEDVGEASLCKLSHPRADLLPEAE